MGMSASFLPRLQPVVAVRNGQLRGPEPGASAVQGEAWVIERLPEHIDAAELVENIAQECGVADKLIKEEVHRHPNNVRVTKAGEKEKPRILKVPFVDQTSRDHFLRNFRKSLPKIPNAPKNLSVRRDMTPPELSLLYDLRRKAYEANVASGLFKHIVVDLRIETLKNPQPFKHK